MWEELRYYEEDCVGKLPITALSEEKPLQGQIWENEQTF